MSDVGVFLFSVYNAVMGSIIALVIYILTGCTNCSLLAGALNHISALSKCFVVKSIEATCLCFYHQGRTSIHRDSLDTI